jgi:hypothetical protein
MLDVVLVAAFAFAGDIGARNAERDVQLKPFLQEIGFDTKRAAAAEELVRVAPPVSCEPIRGEAPVRCGSQLPTSDPTLCWHGVVVAIIQERHLQMETGDTEDSALRFACGPELLTGRVTGARRPDGRLTTKITLERRSDGATATATLAWQPITLPADNPVPWERRLDRLRRPVELARAELLAALQQGQAGEVVDTTPAQCALARKAVAAIPTFPGDTTWQKGVFAWLDAVEADHRRGVTYELRRRHAMPQAAREALERTLAGAPVTTATPLSSLPREALLARLHVEARARDADLAVARQQIRAAHPFTPAP